MIAIQVNNTFLDLFPNTSIQITMICPVFDPDSIERTFSYPFTLPATARNMNALEYVNRLDTTATIKRNCNLFITGVLFESGVLLIKSSDQRGIRCVFQNNSLDIAQRLANIKLRDLTNTITVAEKYCPDVLLSATYPVPTGGIQRQAIGINEHIFDSLITDHAGLINQINAVYPGMASEPALGQAPNENVLLLTGLCPDEYTVYINPPVDTPDIYVFFLPVDSTSTDESERLNTEYNNLLSTTAETNDAAFPVIYAPNIYDDKNEQYAGYLNYTLPDGTHPNDPAAFLDETGFPYTLAPQPFLLPVLDMIANQISQINSFGGLFLDDEEIQKLIFWNNNPIDLFASYVDYIAERENVNLQHSYQGEWNLADMLPDVTALDLINRLINTFCLFIRYSRKVMNLVPRKTLLSMAPEDWTDKAEPGFSLDLEDIAGYTLDYDRQNDDTDISGQLQRVDGGDEALEFTAGIYTLHEKSESFTWQTDPEEDLRTWRIPFINESGRSEYYDLSTVPSIRLLFWRGMQPDAEGDNYALATHGRYNYAGTEVGAYSLDWQGDGGLYDAWWKEYIQLLITGRTVTVPVRLSIQDILNLRQWTHITKHIRFQSGQFVGVVKSVKFSATIRGISVASVEFLQKK